MTINCVQIQWSRAFVLSAAVALAACSSSSSATNNTTDRDGSGGGDAGATNDNRPPESTDALLLADLSGSGDVANPASIDSGANVFVRPADGTGTVFLSSRSDPDGSDYDEYVYDDFTPAADGNISQVLWCGAYINNQLYTAAVSHFTITFYESIAGGSQPLVNNPQLPETSLAFYDTNGNAGEAAAGSLSGKTMYDYQYSLPTPFHVVAGTKYWIRIEASQIGIPDWGIAQGTGGDSTHFMFDTGAARFSTVAGDVAFTLR